MELKINFPAYVKSHINREVNYIVDQYKAHVARWGNSDTFIVMTHPRALFTHTYGNLPKEPWMNVNITKYIQDKADKIMRKMGYDGFKGYSLPNHKFEMPRTGKSYTLYLDSSGTQHNFTH